MTAMSETSAASSACGSGTTTQVMPRALAAIVIGSTPGTARSRPSRVSSPMNTTLSSDGSGTSPLAASSATAMARSKCGPLLGRSAGESRIVTRLVDRPVELAVHDRGPAAVAGLVDGGVRAPDQGSGDQAVGQVDLHVDQVAGGPEQRDGAGGGEPHSGHPRRVLDLRGAAAPQQHAHEVDADAGRAGSPAPRPTARRVVAAARPSPATRPRAVRRRRSTTGS